MLFTTTAALAQQLDIAGPVGSGRFGNSVTVLSNGKIVITDPAFDLTSPSPVTDVGAVYLYDPATGSLLGPLVGSKGNDQVGRGGVTALPNGNYVVSSPLWDGDPSPNAGAVTWCSGVTGCTGAVSAENSLIGSGLGNPVGKVTALSNGNYVAVSPTWDNGAATNAGAVTWCSGMTGCSGVISAANSLTSTRSFTNIGSGGITRLTNGHFVVRSPSWDQSDGAVDVGASTFCSGTTGCIGVVSTANSVVGSTRRDSLGSGVTPLANGGYVVHNPNWDNAGVIDVGAVTACGATGCRGTITTANSLYGTSSPDRVGTSVAALLGGRFVVASPRWGSGRGAVTFCGVTSACVGAVAFANSLVGLTGTPILDEQTQAGSGGITVLSDGDYVVSSPNWDAAPPTDPNPRLDAGAVTWCSGTAGCVGVISPSNSMVGTSPDDQVGTVVALANGNYVVSSPSWDGPAANTGAVTWCGNPSGCTGAVSSAGSLVGSTAEDQVGVVTALTNGNFVVASMGWDGGSVIDAGAVTRCSGAVGCSGAISSGNSLVGSTAGDLVGNVVALRNGGFVVASTSWNNGAISDAGAVTWCDAVSSCVGPVSVANSLIGSTLADRVGAASALTSGDYTVLSQSWDDGGLVNAGAVTFGDGSEGTIGPINSTNSVLGAVAGGGVGMTFAFDRARERLVVGLPIGNVVSLLAVPEPGAAAMGAAALAALVGLRGRRG